MNQTHSWLAIVLLCLVISATSYAQNRSCAADEYLQERLQTDPKFKALFKSYQKDRYTDEQRSALICDNNNSIVIPVAVHYSTPIDCSNQACLLDAAEAQIDILNECFSASNSDLDFYTSTLNGVCGSAYPLSRAPEAMEGTCIQFCLATKNHPASSGLIDGEPAITIDLATWPSAGSDWSGYLNIFVSDGSTAGQGSSTLGISALPGSADGDGFWVNFKHFGGPGFSCSSGGTINSGSSFTGGRTAVHEAGHYFGLYHVFQGSSCGDNDSNPPGPIDVNDTPAQSSPRYGCPSVTSCSNAPSSCSGSYDNFYSFMDYSNDNCMVMFTADQSDVLNYWADHLTFKDSTTVCASITELVNCDGPSCDDGIQNGSEVGIDCGGDMCNPCTYSCGDDMSDNGGSNDYFNNEDISWTICGASGNIVALTFTEFDVEANNSSGCYDEMELYDGGNTSAPSMGVFCGNTLNDAPGGGYIESTSNCITIYFTSDGSVTKPGWNLSIGCGPVPTCRDGIMNGIETGVDCGGNCGDCTEMCGDSYFDTGGGSSNYSNGELVSTLYCPDNSNEKIQATFTYADIEAASGNGNNSTGCWDILYVYDGDSDTAPLIGTYCGEESGDGDTPNQSQNNLFVGRTFLSSHSSGCLYFVFDSDNSVSESGWEAETICLLETAAPVDFLDFYAVAQNNDVELFWTTANEVNNDGFYIERRSETQSVFESIAFVKAAEDQAAINEYIYKDNGLPGGKYYYRLRQVDYDGTADYSTTISVDVFTDKIGSLEIMPNPVSQTLNIEFSPAEDERLISIKIYSKIGQLLKDIPIAENTSLRHSIDVQKLLSGSYIMHLESSQKSYIKRFTKI
jgi:hypothetical protein